VDKRNKCRREVDKGSGGVGGRPFQILRREKLTVAHALMVGLGACRTLGVGQPALIL
jgi:hypothetical protein